MTNKTRKIAFITGANKGIGRETAEQLGTLGYTVLLGSRDVARGTRTVEALTQRGVDAHVVELDVTDTASIQKAAAFVAERWGHIDALVNNAGVGTGAGVATSTLAADVWRAVFDANFFGVVAVTQAMLPLLKKSAAGRIVNVSSSLGSIALNADPGSPVSFMHGKGGAYAASKAALNMLTVHLAHELAGFHIKVNAADPGWVKTDLGGADAPLEVTDGAKTSVALATLPKDGPTGHFAHLGERRPW